MKEDILDYVAGHLVSKVIVDQSKIPYKYYSKIEPLASKIMSWANTFSDVEIDNPVSIVEGGWKAFQKAVESPPRITLSNPIAKFLKANPQIVSLDNVSLIAAGQIISKYGVSKVVKRTDTEELIRINLHGLERDVFLLAITPATVVGGSLDDEDDDDDYAYDDAGGDGSDVTRFLCHKNDIEIVYEYMSHVIWGDDLCMIAGKSNNALLKVTPHEPTTRDYSGPALKYLDSLEKYYKAGIRRNIIFQGIPGSGKTTLCATAMRRFQKRTLYITTDFLREVRQDEWKSFCKIVKPDLVIIDDIDRMSHGVLENLLFMFEDSWYHVPITLMTTNREGSLPAAFRRPGRIDQILEMEDPSDDMRMVMIMDIANMEGITEVPEEYKQTLIEIHKDFSESHLVEFLRRVKVEGWDYKIPENDISFRDLTRGNMKNLINEHSKKVTI